MATIKNRSTSSALRRRKKERQPKWLNQEAVQTHHESEQKKINTLLKTKHLKNAKGLKIQLKAAFEKKNEQFENSSEFKRFSLLFSKYEDANMKESKKQFFEIVQHLIDQNCLELITQPETLNVVFFIVQFASEFINNPVTWKRKSRNIEKQVASILRFCFAKYSIPRFLDQVWRNDDTNVMLSYIEIGKGKNVRNCSTPFFKMSKKMAHYFMQSPDDFSLKQAFLFGQLKSLGASAALMNIILSQWNYIISRYTGESNDYWLKVFQFLVKQSDSDLRKYTDKVLGYLYEMLNDETTMQLKGRTLVSINRMAENHFKEKELMDKGFGKFKWTETNNIQNIEKIYEEKDTLYQLKIIELCSARDLIKEGKKMKNCVATYTSYCVDNINKIFSIRKENWFGHSSIAATVEIDLEDKEITEAKAPCNEEIKGNVIAFLNEWAMLNGLTVNEDL